MRIDKRLADKFGSRTKAAEAISRGLVKVDGKTVGAAYEVKDGDNIEILSAEESFVSLGGYKLSKALKEFGFSVKEKIFADIGASTGGFTDCLLKNGAEKVYCIDVGESQLDVSLKDKNVVVIDGFNARNLNRELFAEELDGVTIDVSFISLTYILGAVAGVLQSGKHVLALIKPQFECESKTVGKNGIVKDGKTHACIIKKIYDFAIGVNLAPKAICNAPLTAKKNKEYVVLLEKDGSAEDFDNLLKCVIL